MAEYLFRKFALENNEKNIKCESAGFFAESGSVASNNTVEVLSELDIDASGHRARCVSELDLSDFDVFVVMSEDMVAFLSELGVNAKMVYVLNRDRGGVADPYGGDVFVYKKVRDDIKCSLQGLYDFVKKIDILNNAEVVSADLSQLEPICEIEKVSYSDPWTKESVRSEILCDNSFFFTLVSRMFVLGYACMKVFQDVADLVKITTHPDFRRLGVARLLMNHLFSCSQRIHLRKLFLEVRESNVSALGLYESCGFVKICLRKNFYQNPVENAISMVKIF